MTTGSTWLRGVRVAAAALLVLSVATTGCGRPDDEAWLRCTGFKQGAETISVLEGKLDDNTSSAVDIELENSSQSVGKLTGIGILVNRTRIDYRMSGFSPPSADYPVNLYLSPPKDNNSTKGTLTAFPLASKSLKQWLIDAGVRNPVVELTARVTFFGETDEGNPLETEGSLRIALTNTGITPTDLPTVNIFTTSNAVKPTTAGSFTVIRTGSLVSTLPVLFTVGGTAKSGIDFEPLVALVTIPAGSDSATITVTPKSGGTAGDTTVKVTLKSGDDYNLGTHTSDTLTISRAPLPTVNIIAQSNAVKPTTAGSFKVIRAGSLGSTLPVLFTVGGTAEPGTDYVALLGSVPIAAGSDSAIITVTPISGGASSVTVIITLSDSSSYTVIDPKSASLTIVP